MKQFAMNIGEFSIGQTIVDSDGASCIITNKTANSIEVFINKKLSDCQTCSAKGKVKRTIESKVPHKNFFKRLFGVKVTINKSITVQCEECVGSNKSHYGIDCTQWFDMRSFNDRFKPMKQK